jgi:hypothetical protein
MRRSEDLRRDAVGRPAGRLTRLISVLRISRHPWFVDPLGVRSDDSVPLSWSMSMIPHTPLAQPLRCAAWLPGWGIHVDGGFVNRSDLGRCFEQIGLVL